MYLKVKYFSPVEIKTTFNFHSFMPLDISFKYDNILCEIERLYCLSIECKDSIIEIFICNKNKSIESIVFKNIRNFPIKEDNIPLSNSKIYLNPIFDTSLIWDELPDDDYYVKIDNDVIISKGAHELQFKWGEFVKSFNVNNKLGISLDKENEIVAITLYNLKQDEINNILSFNR